MWGPHYALTTPESGWAWGLPSLLPVWALSSSWTSPTALYCPSLVCLCGSSWGATTGVCGVGSGLLHSCLVMTGISGGWCVLLGTATGLVCSSSSWPPVGLWSYCVWLPMCLYQYLAGWMHGCLGPCSQRSFVLSQACGILWQSGLLPTSTQVHLVTNLLTQHTQTHTDTHKRLLSGDIICFVTMFIVIIAVFFNLFTAWIIWIWFLQSSFMSVNAVHEVREAYTEHIAHIQMC